ncbi:uncharacterized protein LOC111340477 isoform X4 [Stylophora pistillata]|uniref:uncharacterized protein LOC111340477 isoform X4 n=1 Tax=Stylophora pistillata TaxID=50429 RepID=UPI000C044498|nr:uncharacterized protein LOC111340477 isoform X4 [Stylophora pistillata]
MFRGKVFPVVFALLLILKLHISMSGAQKEVEKTMERGGIEESPKLSKGETLVYPEAHVGSYYKLFQRKRDKVPKGFRTYYSR